VALAHDGAAGPSLILDAGTGLRRVTGLLAGHAFAGTILLTHLHWDHVHGLPFFQAGDRDDARAALLLPQQPGGTAADVLARGMSPPHFPITPNGLRGNWTFGMLEPGQLKAEGFTRRGRCRTRAAGRSATGWATAGR
jgi:glyoxylase-like metal-dependent hydrolase (beta-lactamase superfamily II)